MQVTEFNNVKIYNLSYGKSVPDWFSERKRCIMENNVMPKRRIKLIQDFDMPAVSTGVKISNDGKFAFATGLYKPRIRCYDLKNMSMKFERCFDADAIQFHILSEDYSKVALLQCNRTVEFHAQYGGYYKTRIPKFGRDLAYHQESCDLLLVGASSEIYRLNLEQGRFLSSFQTNASSINKITVHPGYNLLACGTAEGTVEAWDPRMRQRVGLLDSAYNCITDDTDIDGFPSVTALHFKDGLTLGVGTYTGQILLYDIRTNKPFMMKNHMYGLPIKNIEFIKSEELVVSLDAKCVKFWKQSSGKPYTTIQSPVHLNDLCIVPNSGLLFLANEEKRILTYFIPSIGPAPQWALHLDSCIEDLEETKQDAVYDDYKFVTKEELEKLHLDHLQGTNLLRAYMHGYFMDIRLYNKAKAIVQPTAYKDLKQKIVRNKIDQERKNQILVKQLPTVNREYAQKLLEKKTNYKLKEPTPFEDDRFKDLFENPDFMINEADEEYARVKSTVEKSNKKKVTIIPESAQMRSLAEEGRRVEEYTSSQEEESDDDEEAESESDSEEEAYHPRKKKREKLFEAVDSERFSMFHKEEEEDNLTPIGERLKNADASIKQMESSAGNKVVTFNLKKPNKQSKRDEERKAHLKERAKYRRPAKLRK